MTDQRLNRALELANKLDSSVYSGRGEDIVRPEVGYSIIDSGDRYELALLVQELVELAHSLTGLQEYMQAINTAIPEQYRHGPMGEGLLAVSVQRIKDALRKAEQERDNFQRQAKDFDEELERHAADRVNQLADAVRLKQERDEAQRILREALEPSQKLADAANKWGIPDACPVTIDPQAPTGSRPNVGDFRKAAMSAQKATK